MEKIVEKIVTKKKFLKGELILSNESFLEIGPGIINNDIDTNNKNYNQGENINYDNNENQNNYNENNNEEEANNNNQEAQIEANNNYNENYKEEEENNKIDNNTNEVEEKNANNNENNNLNNIDNNIESNENNQKGPYNKKMNQTQIHMDDFQVITKEDFYKLKEMDEKEGFDDIKTIKELDDQQIATITESNDNLENESDIEQYRKSCLEKVKNLRLDLLLTEKNIAIKKLKEFTQNELNTIEILAPKGDSINVFNPFSKEVKEILIPAKKKFPTNCAYLNIPPYCFISGGIKIEENAETSDFFAIRRKERKHFEFIALPPMVETKRNHCMIELKYLNGIGVIGGKDTLDCEVYDFGTKEWYNLPELNTGRENSSCIVLNEKNLYCFLGYDSEGYKMNTTIEKLDLETKESWEEINPNGLQAIMKRKSSSCLDFNVNGNNYILIIGGVNSLGNESNDFLIYDEANNQIERKADSLPFKCSFNQNSFIFFDFSPNTSYHYNFTKDSKIIQYERTSRVFFELKNN